MKHQALFPIKIKVKKIKCRLLQFLFGALRVKCILRDIYFMRYALGQMTCIRTDDLSLCKYYE